MMTKELSKTIGNNMFKLHQGQGYEKKMPKDKIYRTIKSNITNRIHKSQKQLCLEKAIQQNSKTKLGEY